ncbi:rhodanese-like domain-containing protein [Christiangramia sabulilitoris]|nr:rhodanese-like domain-containing protein [Christiangramia sabulilitoris]
MTRNFLILIFMVQIFSPVQSQNSLGEILKKYNSGSIPYISAEELRMHQLNGDVIILDARENEEFIVSHIPGAIYIGYNDFELSGMNDIQKNKKIVVYCSIGIRSEDIAIKLAKAGYKNIRNLYGGIFGWKQSGFPVMDIKNKPTNKVHAYSRHWAKWLENAEKIY